MKKFLRKWLEVPEVIDIAGFASEGNIKEMVEDAICEAMDPSLSAQHVIVYWGRPQHKNIRGLLQGYVHSLLNEVAENKVGQHVGELVDAEEFIDRVVKRIKRKQL